MVLTMRGLYVVFITTIVTVLIIGNVESHAVLYKPSPWWWAASRERPCGGGEYNPEPSTVWEMGSVQVLRWWVIALDGTGNVSARINTAGTTNFDTSSTTVHSVPIIQPPGLIRSQGYHNITLTVPNVNCTGPNNTCTMQFWTNNGGGWYTCMTVNITCKGCAPVKKPEIPNVCVRAPNITFCSYKSLTQVRIAQGQHASTIDKLIGDTFTLNQPNINVFASGTNQTCIANYKKLICEYYLPPCGSFSATFSRQKCKKVLEQDCKITSLHKNIYDCFKFRDETEIYVPPSAPVTPAPPSTYVPPSTPSPYVPPSKPS